MAQQTTAQARVIDPMLTTVARGWRSPQAAVADVLFPRVSVGARAGKILSFGAEDFMLINSKRAPGANTKRVQFGYASGDFSLVDYSLEGSVPRELMEEAQAVPNLNQGAMAIRKVQNMMELEREVEAATLATTAANYPAGNKVTLSGNDQWNVVHTDSDPFTDIETGKEAIRAKIGYFPNVLELGPKVLTALRSHPKVLDRLSTASDRPPATIQQLQALFEVDQIVVGRAVYNTGTATAPTFADVWGKHALLAYTQPASAAEMGSPSFGYTYQLNGYPFAEQAYWDPNSKTWYYPYTDARKPYLVGATAGYLITDAVS
jgi:hypothetical protein